MAKTKVKRFISFLKKRFSKWFIPSGIIIFFILIILSLSLPKNQLQLLKESLLRNPEQKEMKLKMIENLLKENQFQASEEILKSIPQENESLNQLWQKKNYADPEDVRELIKVWEEIIKDKPQYRDAYLQLAILNYKINEKGNALENLQKALEIDPNFELAKKLEAIIIP